ncbi:uncharacterized protein N7459_007707 [Penicillium hispanicum]|uniref:uncharacterized protein n=1 Tax=Penicillium hispanicum TaxID=1080232 RepID=UPI00253F75D1|nr:uncharacterized protein N7459_007707 [Penicillium hispanicum]KAJ5578743.1 hypothetical protein N7459_007707 [Penicillium hispanicum]
MFRDVRDVLDVVHHATLDFVDAHQVQDEGAGRTVAFLQGESTKQIEPIDILADFAILAGKLDGLLLSPDQIPGPLEVVFVGDDEEVVGQRRWTGTSSLAMGGRSRVPQLGTKIIGAGRVHRAQQAWDMTARSRQ